MSPADRLVGCLIGTAVCDSLLLPMEGLPRQRIARRFAGELRQGFAFGYGMVSDDTEHAFLTARALAAVGIRASVEHREDRPNNGGGLQANAEKAMHADAEAARFARALARRLRWWLVSLPPGCGMATAKGLLRAWFGVSPARSGVRSAGNGPSMRAAIIGAVCAGDPARRMRLVEASTAITHQDAAALAGAQAVAVTAALLMRSEAASPEPVACDPAAPGTAGRAASEGAPILMSRAPTTALSAACMSAWENASEDPGWQRAMTIVRSVADRADGPGSVDDLAAALGCPHSVSGWSLTSVPVALYAWWRHRGDSEACLRALRTVGGDTDTMGAIAGALLGIDRGETAFPPAWRERVFAWPMTLSVLRSAGRRLAGELEAVRWCWPAQPLRNLAMLCVAFAHVVRRMLARFA